MRVSIYLYIYMSFKICKTRKNFLITIHSMKLKEMCVGKSTKLINKQNREEKNNS